MLRDEYGEEGDSLNVGTCEHALLCCECPSETSHDEVAGMGVYNAIENIYQTTDRSRRGRMKMFRPILYWRDCSTGNSRITYRWARRWVSVFGWSSLEMVAVSFQFL